MASPSMHRTSFGEAAYHEFYRDDFEPRPHYQPLWEHIRRAGQSLLSEKGREAHWALQTDGVTFTVYGDEDEGIERVWPLDLLPRIIPAAEWRPIEAGLKQRVRALDAFLLDLYTKQQVIRDGVVPAELIYHGKDFRREIQGIRPPHDLYIHISGIDLVRDADGNYLVLEDNLRTPSGVSYMIENRIVVRRTLPEFFSKYRVRRVEHYPSLLAEALRGLSPRGRDDAVVVLLTPGIYNSAYFEHTFLALRDGHRAGGGARPRHRERRRLPEDDPRPAARRRDLPPHRRRLSRSALLPARLDARHRRRDQRLARGQRRDRQRAGHRHRRRQGGLSLRTGPDPLLPRRRAAILGNVPTYRMTIAEERAYVLDHLDNVVVKAVSESGGYGMLMGPASTKQQRAEFAQRIQENPRGYIAQPVIPLSRHLCHLDGELESRHLDLRPFVINGEEIHVVPGGLTRVALTKGSLVVNSSQGGGSKDTWVLADAESDR